MAFRFDLCAFFFACKSVCIFFIVFFAQLESRKISPEINRKDLVHLSHVEARVLRAAHESSPPSPPPLSTVANPSLQTDFVPLAFCSSPNSFLHTVFSDLYTFKLKIDRQYLVYSFNRLMWMHDLNHALCSPRPQPYISFVFLFTFRISLFAHLVSCAYPCPK